MAQQERDILEHAIHSISEQAAKADRWCDPMNLSAELRERLDGLPPRGRNAFLHGPPVARLQACLCNQARCGTIRKPAPPPSC